MTYCYLFQVARLNSSYPGGLASYIKIARELLADSKDGRNPFDGFTPSVSYDTPVLIPKILLDVFPLFRRAEAFFTLPWEFHRTWSHSFDFS